MSNFTKLNELEQMGKMFENQPEVDKNVRFYIRAIRNSVNLQQANEELIKEIDAIINTANATASPAKLKAERYKLEAKILDLELSFQTKKNYYENWLREQSAFNAKFAELTIDYTENYQKTLAQAKEIAKRELPLSAHITNFEEKEYTGALQTIVDTHGTTLAAINAIIELSKTNAAVKVGVDAYYDANDAPEMTPEQKAESYIKHMQHQLQKYRNEFYLYIKSVVVKHSKK